MCSVRKRFDGMLRWMRQPFVLPFVMMVMVMGMLAERAAAASSPNEPTGRASAERRTSVSGPRSTRSTWFHDSELEDADELDDSGEPFSEADLVTTTHNEPPAECLGQMVNLFADPSGGLAPSPGFRRLLDPPP